MDVSPGRMTVVTGAGAPFGRKVVRSGVALEVPSSKIQFSSVPRDTLGTLGFCFADTEVPRLEGPPATLWRGKPPTDPPEARSRAGATLYLP